MDQESKRERRVRYKGTHPRSFNEKYKELQPDQYSEDVEKIKKQGKTPAGMHRAVCVDEIIDFLQPAPGQRGLDATLGYGGHSIEILNRIIPGGRLYATDVDPLEMPKTIARISSMGYPEDNFTARRMNFSEINRLVEESGPLDFIIADLGVSSMQIDNPERGFSFKTEGPLDLRLDPYSGKPASEFLQTVSREDLEEIFLENSDELYSLQIAKAITSHIAKGNSIDTTTELKNIIGTALEPLPVHDLKEEIRKACQRCFQALRIEVNNEFAVLEKFLEKIPYALSPGGRVAILSFHSGEDRRVKKSFQLLFREGIYSEISPSPVRASAEECFANPRARSAKLRCAIKE